jgi:hypothetical protein
MSETATNSSKNNITFQDIWDDSLNELEVDRLLAENAYQQLKSTHTKVGNLSDYFQKFIINELNMNLKTGYLSGLDNISEKNSETDVQKIFDEAYAKGFEKGWQSGKLQGQLKYVSFC